MLHSHAFATPPRKRFLPRIPDAQPLTPEGYLRLRRKAAGLEIRDLGIRLAQLRAELIEAGQIPAGALVIRQSYSGVIMMLEAPGVRARMRETLDAIAAVMPFDADVYQQLADADPRRHPRVCRGCGCSQHDGCHHEHYGSCAWVSPTQCSHCAAREAQA